MKFFSKRALLYSLAFVLITTTITTLNAAGKPPLPPQTVARLEQIRKGKETARQNALFEKLVQRVAAMHSPDAVAFVTHSAAPTPCFCYKPPVVCEQLPGIAEDLSPEAYEAEATALASPAAPQPAAIEQEEVSPEIYALITERIVEAFKIRPYQPFMTDGTYGSEPLIVACTHQDVNYNLVAVQRLLKWGANPNLLSLKGKTILTEACKRGKKELVVALLGTKYSPHIYPYPVDVNRPDKTGKTPLAYAIEYCRRFYMQPLFIDQLETAKAIINVLETAGAV